MDSPTRRWTAEEGWLRRSAGGLQAGNFGGQAQVIEDSFDGLWLGDPGEDFALAAAVRAAEDVCGENAGQKFGPGDAMDRTMAALR